MLLLVAYLLNSSKNFVILVLLKDKVLYFRWAIATTIIAFAISIKLEIIVWMLSFSIIRVSSSIEVVLLIVKLLI